MNPVADVHADHLAEVGRGHRQVPRDAQGHETERPVPHHDQQWSESTQNGVQDSTKSNPTLPCVAIHDRDGRTILLL